MSSKLDMFNASVIAKYFDIKNWRDYIEFFICHEVVMYLNKDSFYTDDIDEIESIISDTWGSQSQEPFARIVTYSHDNLITGRNLKYDNCFFSFSDVYDE